MTKQEQLIASRTDKELIRDWMALDSLKVTPEVATVRGWFMKEIERRFPAEFNNWIENCDTNDNLEDYIKLEEIQSKP